MFAIRMVAIYSDILWVRVITFTTKDKSKTGEGKMKQKLEAFFNRVWVSHEPEREAVSPGKTYKVFRLAFLAVFIMALLFILFCNYIDVDGVTIATAILLTLVGFVFYRFHVKRFSLYLFLSTFVITMILALVLDTPITSDFRVQYEAAQSFAKGDFSFGEDEYFQTYPFQTGLVIVEGFLLKIWNDPLIIRIMNCFLTAGINVMIYGIAKEFFTRKSAQIVSVFHLLFIFPTVYVTVLNNQIFSTFFLYLGLYLLIAKRFETITPITKYLLVGVCWAVGNAVRPEGILFLVSLVVYLLFGLFRQFSAKNFIRFLKRGIPLVGTYFLISILISQTIIWTGVSSAGLENRATLWKFVIGTNYNTSGGVNNHDPKLIEERMEQYGYTRSEAELSIIKERVLVSPVRLIELAKKKTEVFWWDSDRNGAELLDYPLSNHLKEKCPFAIEWAVQITRNMLVCIFLLAFLGTFKLLFSKGKKDNRLKAYLIPFLIFTTFVVYLAIEVQPRYSYIIHPAVFILATGGIQMIHRFISRITDKVTRDNETAKDLPVTQE